VADYLRRAQRPEARALDGIASVRKTMEEAGGEQIARARRVDQLVDRLRGHTVDLSSAEHARTLGTAGHHTQLAAAAQLGQRRLEILLFGE
jgi:hypothetical protein